VHSSAEAANPSANAGTLNLNVPGDSVLQAEIADLTRRSQVGANWFFWIAGLSFINSVIVLMDGRWSFLAGLGITQFIDGMAKALSPKLGGAAVVFALLMDLVAAGVIILFGLMARQRHNWAFVLGMILYGLDGLLFLLVGDWLSLAFHAYALYCIYRGLSANTQLKALQPDPIAPRA
jgi:hypothetical protein